jgi:LPXTG-motif cell wall-anchored protein
MAEDFEVNGGLPEESENRTFVIAAAGLGGLIVLSMICLGVYALVLQPAQREAAESRPTEIMLTNTAVALGLTETVEAEQATATPAPSNTPFPTSTSRPTNTPTQVVVLPTDEPTSTPFTTLPTLAPETATAAAEQTATAEAVAGGVDTPTSTPEPTATALPTTGFGDEAGLPGLAGLAAVLLAVIFLSRRLRTGPTAAN